LEYKDVDVCIIPELARGKTALGMVAILVVAGSPKDIMVAARTKLFTPGLIQAVVALAGH
jgi:hypothetical protein